MITDIEEAILITRQIYSKASDPMLTRLLTDSKGSKGFRPWYVAALFILTEYRRLIKADEATFDYDIDKTIQGLIAQQRPYDIGAVIPLGFTLDDLIMEAEQESHLPSVFVL